MTSLLLNSYHDNINLYLEKYNLLFYNIPKVASSSLWSICAYAEMGYQTKESEKIRSITLPSIKSSDLEEYPNVKKVAFVRNPFDRVVSCYGNKILKKDYKFITQNGLSEDTTFEQFVDFISQTPDSDSDRHFRSQYTFIFNHKSDLLADYVGRFESFEHDIKEVISQFQLPSISIPHWNKEITRHYSDYYTDTLIERLKKRYEIDLLLFGYEYNIELDPQKRDAWKQELPLEVQIEILKCKSQKLLRIIKHKEKYDDLPKGFRGYVVRKYKQYFTNYFE